MSTRSGNRTLAAGATLESLKKEAKHWRRSLREGDAAALERLRRFAPDASGAATLREVQHALAREHGLEGWGALKALLADRALARRTSAERADDFLRHAVDRAGGAAAAHLLRRHPDVARFSTCTAAAAGDLAEVERRIAADAASAAAPGGPLGWQPLQYLCFARTSSPETSAHAVAIARALLDAGADPRATWKDDWDNPFTLLTGVLGEGEGRVLPHPQAAELAELLIARGAEPFDTQGLYNTSLHRDDTFWLEFLHARSAAAGGAGRWRDTEAWKPEGMLDDLLGNAVSRNHTARARWLLEHGASARARHRYSKRNLHTEALLGGFAELARLLVHFGAQPEALDDVQTFHAACMAGDRDTARRLAAARPEFLRYPGPMVQAAETDRTDVVELLLDLGMSPDVEHGAWTALHSAAHSGALGVARLLIERGASVDVRDAKHKATPLGHALWARQLAVAELLGEVSRDVFALARAGTLERLRCVLDAEPGLAAARLHGRTPLFHLTAPEERAVEVAELLLERGVDPALADADGRTAVDVAAGSGLDDLADLLREARA